MINQNLFLNNQERVFIFGLIKGYLLNKINQIIKG